MITKVSCKLVRQPCWLGSQVALVAGWVSRLLSPKTQGRSAAFSDFPTDTPYTIRDVYRLTAVVSRVMTSANLFTVAGPFAAGAAFRSGRPNGSERQGHG